MNNTEQEIKIQFPIRELSARTQVNTITLRAWERRYGLLKPARTNKGHRLYSEEDVSTVERILALVARGVPLGKVKHLLHEDSPLVSNEKESEHWADTVKQLLAALEMYSANKVESIMHEAFANYPVPVCRERLLEPTFAELAAYDTSGAISGFTESELLRYTALRLSTKVVKEKGAVEVMLIAGDQAPIWRLALMALELVDLKFKVHLLQLPFNISAVDELAQKLKETSTVFFQDGLWKAKEQDIATKALHENDRLFMCGTAPKLSQLDHDERVFENVTDCITGLLNHHSISRIN